MYKVLKFNLILAIYLCMIPFGYIIEEFVAAVASDDVMNFGYLPDALVQQEVLAENIYILSTALIAIILSVISLIAAHKKRAIIVGQILAILGGLTALPVVFLSNNVDLHPKEVLFSSIGETLSLILLVVSIILLFAFCQYEVKEKNDGKEVRG